MLRHKLWIYIKGGENHEPLKEPKWVVLHEKKMGGCFLVRQTGHGQLGGYFFQGKDMPAASGEGGEEDVIRAQTSETILGSY